MMPPENLEEHCSRHRALQTFRLKRSFCVSSISSGLLLLRLFHLRTRVGILGDREGERTSPNRKRGEAQEREVLMLLTV